VAFPLMLAYNFLSGRVENVEKEAWSEALKYESYVFSADGSHPGVNNATEGSSPSHPGKREIAFGTERSDATESSSQSHPGVSGTSDGIHSENSEVK
jgi:biopolymer transport protein ExbB